MACPDFLRLIISLVECIVGKPLITAINVFFNLCLIKHIQNTNERKEASRRKLKEQLGVPPLRPILTLTIQIIHCFGTIG